MHKREICLDSSNQDQAFIEELPVLPGVVERSRTGEEALRSVNHAVQVWIDTATSRFGSPVPEPKGKHLMIV